MSSSSYADFYDAADKGGHLGAPIIPPTEYVGKIVTVKIEDKGTDKKINLHIEITEGALAGKKVWSNMNLLKAKPNVSAIFFNTAAKFGLPKEFWFRTPAPTNNEVEANLVNKVVRVKASEPKEYNGAQSQFINIQSVVTVAALSGVVQPLAAAPVLPAQQVVAAVQQPAQGQVQAAFNPLGAPVAQAG